MAEHGVNEDLKARMREALEKKKSRSRGGTDEAPTKEKAHGSEVDAAAPQMHRRKAGGGGS